MFALRTQQHGTVAALSVVLRTGSQASLFCQRVWRLAKRGTAYCTAPSQCWWLGWVWMHGQLLNVCIAVHRRGNHMKELSADKDKDLGHGDWWLTWNKGRLWLSSSPHPKHSFDYMPYRILLFKTIYIVYLCIYYTYESMRSYDLFLSLLLWWLLLVLWNSCIFGPVNQWPYSADSLLRFLTARGWKSRLASEGQSQVEIEGEDLSVPKNVRQRCGICGFGWDRNWYMDEISMKSGWYPDDIAAIASHCSTFLMATERSLFYTILPLLSPPGPTGFIPFPGRTKGQNWRMETQKLRPKNFGGAAGIRGIRDSGQGIQPWRKVGREEPASWWVACGLPGRTWHTHGPHGPHGPTVF